MSQRPTINYGLCEGGPWHQKHLADARPTFAVMIDPHSKKAIPGAIRGTKGGEYVFDGKTWIWQDAIRSASKTAPPTESAS